MDLYEELDKLGDSVESITESLLNLNMKGRRGTSRSCPVARYFQRMPGVGFVSIGVCTGTIYDAKDREILGQCDSFPPAVRDFIRAFDKGEIPELDSTLDKQEEPEDKKRSMISKLLRRD